MPSLDHKATCRCIAGNHRLVLFFKVHRFETSNVRNFLREHVCLRQTKNVQNPQRKIIARDNVLVKRSRVKTLFSTLLIPVSPNELFSQSVLRET